MLLLKISRFSLAGVLLLFSSISYAQQNGVSSSDWPDRTQGTGTLNKRNFQVENGVTLGSEDLLNNFMLRYGLTDATELRLLIDAGKEDGVVGVLPITLGLKQRILEQNGALPAVAFVGSLMIQPLATKDFRDTGLDFMLRLAFDHNLSDSWSFGYNLAPPNFLKTLKLPASSPIHPVENGQVMQNIFPLILILHRNTILISAFSI